MDTTTYSQVQDLVKQLPVTKLSLAYNLLRELAEKESDKLSPRFDFMRLPLLERRRIMAQQAERMAPHYERTADERKEWQSGEFITTPWR